MQAVRGTAGVHPSLPVQGAWIEMFRAGRAFFVCLSLPVQGAWIEIGISVRKCNCRLSLPVQGAWIEMLSRHVFIRGWLRRSPCRERGLKYSRSFFPPVNPASLPVQGAWIEMRW